MEKELKAGMFVKRTKKLQSKFEEGEWYEISKYSSGYISILCGRDEASYEISIASKVFDLSNPLPSKPDPFKDYLLSLQASAHSNENTDILNKINIIIHEYEKTR